MREQAVYCYYAAGNKMMGLLKKACAKAGKRYRPSFLAGKKVRSAAEGNDWLREKLLSGEALAAVRYGGFELGACKIETARELGLVRSIPPKYIESLHVNAGFFPADPSLLERYLRLEEETSAAIDMLVTNAYDFENYMLSRHIPDNVFLADNRALEPYYLSEGVPWTKALEGRKVLVIHPFEDSIRSQYEKREKLFPGKDILPRFELLTLKAVQTIAGNRDSRFETWFDALDYMAEEALKKDFDVAVLGCGAYGQPLASILKSAGKQAVHIGGATQILFGIKGKRWDSSPLISAMYNDYWVRPSADEVPSSAARVEGACYW